MPEYTVISLMNDKPKLWKGPHGDVWYHGVNVEGWDKPISVGKKEANSIKVGDTIYGDIIETDYIEDKFKPSQKPDEPSEPSGSVVIHSTPKADNRYLRDVTAIPLDVYRVRANIDGLPSNETERAVFFENVMADANELLALIDKVREA
jgi:hypothetical protein